MLHVLGWEDQTHGKLDTSKQASYLHLIIYDFMYHMCRKKECMCCDFSGDVQKYVTLVRMKLKRYQKEIPSIPLAL